MTFLPPTVQAPPPRQQQGNTRRRVTGVIVILLVIAGIGGLGYAGYATWWRHLDDEVIESARIVALPDSTTTTTEADAGLVADLETGPPVVLDEVPDPLRGVAEVGGLRARLIGSEVTDASWSISSDVAGGGRWSVRTGAEEFLLAPDRAIADPNLADLATRFAGATSGDDRTEDHATTVAGLPAHYAMAAESTPEGVIRTYVLAIDVGDTFVLATLEGTNIDAASLATEWERYVASIEPI